MKNNIIDIKRVETTTTEPVTLTEVKEHLLVTFSDDDTLLTSMITQARTKIEDWCNVSIIAKTVTMIADLYNEWELPYGPVIGIQGVQTRTTTQGSGLPTYETLTSGWGVDGVDFLTFDPFFSNTEWNMPADVWLQGGDLNYRYKLIYTVGYNPVPVDLKLAILNEIAFRYENRGEGSTVLSAPGICQAAAVLAQAYKRISWL